MKRLEAKDIKRSNRLRKWMRGLFITTLLAALAIVILVMLIPKAGAGSVIIPWNPGGMPDLVTRVLLEAAGEEAPIENMPGSNGALGINEVFSDSRDGKLFLGTNLSSLATSKYLGFAETDHIDWEMWLVAYAPAVVAVRADSPYGTLDSLLAAAGERVLRCANTGGGTIGYVAAHLFADRAGIEVEHRSYSGSNPAVVALMEDNADFLVALMPEIYDRLRSGEFTMLSEIEDFGEYYGLMVPKGTPGGMLDRYDKRWAEAAGSEFFKSFTQGRGLVPLEPDRIYAAQTAGHLASIFCWTLFDTGYVNISPDGVGIGRP
jgi:hypothetical protein